jgi:RNA polymerase sigma-70 factor (ECF subfamily)
VSSASLQLPISCAVPRPPVAYSAALRQNVAMEPLGRPERLAADGRGAGIADLYGEVRRSLLTFLRKHTGDAQVAEDVLHDVVVKALVASQHGNGAPHNLTGWLYAVARNAAMDVHRRARPTEELPEDLQAPLAEEDVTAAELANCLRPMAERLPGTYRDTVIAAEFDGMSLADIAKAQGLSLSAVKTRASRGRRLLQQELVECCRVALSPKGAVMDYDVRKAAACAPGTAGCRTAGSCKPG